MGLPSVTSRFRALKRAALLEIIARHNPGQLLESSLRRLPNAVRRAMRESRAWKTLLSEAGLGPVRKVDPATLLRQLPVVEKSTLFERFTVKELLARDVSPAELSGVLTSSGHGGRSFAFGLISRAQAKGAAAGIDIALQQAFGIDNRSTLLLNCLPMGVGFTSDTVCIANVSVREDMALAILRKAAPLFEQVILCIDPLFGKRLLDYSKEAGFDWSALKTHVVLGEETFSEEFRSYLATTLGAAIDSEDPEAAVIGSSMGVGELGLNLFFETSETIEMRRTLHRQDPDRVLPTFFCFNPLRTLVEVHQPDSSGVGDLVVTLLDADTPIPMLRYRTGDRARWVTSADTEVLPTALQDAMAKLPLPVIALTGRDRDQIRPGWHVDHFKGLLYRLPEVADCLSGAFRVTQDAGYRWELQLARHCALAPEAVSEQLSGLTAAHAAMHNTEAPEVVCYSFERFPYGMNLDYERKFRYYPGS